MSVMSLRNRSTPDRARGSQAGSAYISVLLVLVILTIMGLSLATITGLEMEVGSNERTQTRTFYSAQSGMALAVAQVLTTREYRARQLQLDGGTHTADGSTTPITRGFRVDVSATVPILVEPCNLCPVNENEVQFFKINHALNSTATEQTWTGTSTVPGSDAATQGQKRLAMMIEIQPWWQPPWQGLPEDSADLPKGF